MVQGTELGSVELRNLYRVHEVGDNYRVESWSGRQWHASLVLRRNVDIIAQALRGGTVTVNEVLDRIERGEVRGLDLRSRSYKIRYEVQDMLVVLVVRGEAAVARHGRGFVYHIGTRAGHTAAGA